jgi:aryl-alcohol dehydrogenase-like predicted oxidoreductase
MQYRKLGRTGLEISDVGYGAWGIGGRQWQGGTDDESIRALHLAFKLGLNFIDTALAYGDGHSERLVAQVLKTAPHRIFVATKIPPKNRLWPARPGTKIKDVFPRGYIVECTGESLRNLGVETIDLQQLHVWNPEWLEHDDWKRGLEDIKKSGKVRFLGISINDHQPDSAIEIIKTGLIDTVQVIYNIFDQTPEQNLFALTQESNIGVIARVPFDEGSLTGTITEETNFGNDEFRAHYFRGDHKKQVVGHINKRKKDLEGEEGTLPEIALRFCLSHSAVSTVIPGMRKVRNVEANCAASDKGPLPEAMLNKLRRHAWDKNFYS